MAVKVKENGLKQLKCDFNYCKFGIEIIEKQRHENSEHKIFIKILDRLSDCHEKKIDIEDVIKDIESDFSYDMSGDVVNQVSKNERLIRTLIDIVSENNATENELKVTEINLTGDILANEVHSYLVNSRAKPIEVNYKLFVKSVDKVSEHMRENAKQWDGKELLSLTTSDLIIYRDSHKLCDLKFNDLINQFITSLNNNGFLIIISKYCLTKPEEAINSLINKNINNFELENRIQYILKNTADSRLKLIARKSDSLSTMAMMFRKVTEKKIIPKHRDVIEVKGERNEIWFEAIKERLQKYTLDDSETKNNVWLIANDTNINGIVGLINCLRLEPNGIYFRCLFDMNFSIELPIDWTSKPFSDILTNDLVINVIKNGNLGTYRHLKLPKDYDKIVSNRYYLNQGANKDISSLTWFDLKNIVPNNEPRNLTGNPIQLVPVNIYTNGLIFKDVLFTTGNTRF